MTEPKPDIDRLEELRALIVSADSALSLLLHRKRSAVRELGKDFEREVESVVARLRNAAPAMIEELRRLTKERDDALAEVEMDRDFKAELIQRENDEASVCPEDVGFVEYIGVLQCELRRLREVEQAAKALMADDAAPAHIEWPLRQALRTALEKGKE